MKKIIVALLALSIMSALFAHEYVLMAYHFKLKKGDELEVHLFVADGFNVQLERPIQHSITKKFELLTEDSIIDLANQQEGTLPVINRKVDFAGGGLIHLERDFSRIALPTPNFFEYLKEDHIDNIAPKVDSRKKEQREKYYRFIKALVQSGDRYTDTLFKQVTNQRFEIILLQNPYLLHTGSVLQAKIFFDGKPLINKTMTARNRKGSEPSLAIESKTNALGICSFKLTRTGDWFIHGTFMLPNSDKTDSDWESFWTSYSFGLEK